LENFTTVKFLADGFVNSPIAKYLTIGYGITFEDLNIKEYRPRSLSLPERITIYQLSERDISNFLMQQLTPQHYSEIDIAINQIANSQDTIWTTNQRYREQFNIRGTYLTPRQSGTNEYSDKTTAVWLASMKTHSMDVKTAMLVAGFNQQTLTTIQELEPLHQFITRTNIRKFDDDTKTNVIVFGPQQADCLAKRYGISKDAIVHLNVELPEKGKPGRKPKPKPKPRKKRKPGRKPSPLPKAERERWRRYLKKVNAGKAPDPINNAWFVNAAKTLGKYEDRFSDLPR